MSNLNSRLRRNYKIPLLRLILALWLAAPAAAPAAEDWTPTRVADGLADRYRQVDSLVAAYRRVATTPATDQLFKSSSRQVATGVLYWARPDRLRLDQTSPQPEAMVTDGATVWWHLPSENLVYRYRKVNVAGELKPLLSFLGGLATLTRDFDLAPAQAEPARPGQRGLRLTPKDGDRSVDHLTVWCDETFTLTGFVLATVTGETTDFFLTGFAENREVEPTLFTFKIPRGAEVIEEEN
ncbi:MAG: outer membrane lipoprotein carrier protein LolA [Candidatus Adiutrix sp.]|jgi:outer membrane lipoprotein-sorting protein|nr:outer membrane lipoprotein carrier protein LolA [Candidatus Adiutrix sp.]